MCAAVFLLTPVIVCTLTTVERAVRHGLPPAAGLDAITCNPSRALGLQQRVGSLRRGLDADLLLVDRHPAEPGARIHTVMIDGVVEYRNPDLP